MSKATKPGALPSFTSDRMRMLAPLITPRIYATALERVLTGEKFFYENALKPQFADLSEAELKLIFIIVIELNPREDLDCNEQGALRGMTRQQYSKKSALSELKR